MPRKITDKEIILALAIIEEARATLQRVENVIWNSIMHDDVAELHSLFEYFREGVESQFGPIQRTRKEN